MPHAQSTRDVSSLKETRLQDEEGTRSQAVQDEEIRAGCGGCKARCCSVARLVPLQQSRMAQGCSVATLLNCADNSGAKNLYIIAALSSACPQNGSCLQVASCRSWLESIIFHPAWIAMRSRSGCGQCAIPSVGHPTCRAYSSHLDQGLWNWWPLEQVAELLPR